MPQKNTKGRGQVEAGPITFYCQPPIVPKAAEPFGTPEWSQKHTTHKIELWK